MSDSISFYKLSDLAPAGYAALLKRTEADLEPFLKGVRPILENVRENGDAALVAYAKKFDHAALSPTALKCSEEEFEVAEAALASDVKEAIEFAVDNIRRFHKTQLPEPMKTMEIHPGVFVGEKTTPIPSVACYAPRGKGAFPSVALMTTIPAVTAGVEHILLITPPGPDGTVDAGTLYAARIAGVANIFKCGGAQGVAAVAYGTQTIPKTVKIVGPGSPWVVAAKRLLADIFDTGLPAGPSESIVLADSTANPRIATLDLIIESEHGPDSSAFLITDSPEIAETARRTIPEFLKGLSETRMRYATSVLSGKHGGIILADTLSAAIGFINDFAPEHLEILSDNPHQYLDQVKNAGEILLGRYTPFTLGNYLLGPNAVLPTSQWAKTFSPLSVHDFLKRSSLAHVTENAYPKLAEKARILARYEGFDAHAQAVSSLRNNLLKS
jgi:histidinol dehydrogenase